MYLSEDKFCESQAQRDLNFDIPVKCKIFNALRVKYFYSTTDQALTKIVTR